MKPKVQSHRDLEVYRRAFSAAMTVFTLSKQFPKEERYALIDQVRRSLRAVCANLGEAWRKRRYEAAFVSKLDDCEAEAAESQVWLEFAVKCGYLKRETALPLYREYEEITRMLVAMICNPTPWLLLRERK